MPQITANNGLALKNALAVGNLQLDKRHSLQRCRISLALLCRAKDGFSYRLHMC